MRWTFLVVIGACSKPASPAAPRAAEIAIDTARFEATVKYLASDELEGRGTGTRGGAKAEDYIAEQFKQVGLEPAGERGTYFQAVPLTEATRVDAKSSLVIHTKSGDIELAGMRDVLLSPFPRAANVSVEAPLVFLGYGMKIDGYDDFAGIDVRDKIVVVFGGAPRSLGGQPVSAAQHAVLADTKLRRRTLAKLGAKAVIVVYDPARAARMSFETFLPKVAGSTMAWTGEPDGLPYVLIGEAGLDKVLAAIPAAPKAKAIWESLDKGVVPKVDLAGATASLAIAAELKTVTGRNVVGLLRGTTDELVVYSAHHDHLGIGPAIDGDTIYNGALDNASGVAGILEIARAFAALPAKPRRSILFLAVTAEEKGLLGSDYFAEHPTVPRDKIVANINLDGLNLLYESHDIVPLGAEHSTLMEHVTAAARDAGLSVSPDPDPDQVYFIRSDQYNFVKRGIPSVFPVSGWKDATGSIEANKKLSDTWGEQYYHRPADHWLPSWNAAWVARELRFDFMLGLAVASAAGRPRWNPGDYFGRFSTSSDPAPARQHGAPPPR